MSKFLVFVIPILISVISGSIVDSNAETNVISSDTTMTSLTVNSVDILQVNPGVTLVITSGIENSGIIINQGIIENGGIFTNNKIVSIDFGARIINKGGAALDNFGTITNKGLVENHGFISNNGVLGNHFNGTIKNFENGSLDNDLEGTITNDGIIENFGTIINDGDFGNYGGTISNYGLFLNNLIGMVVNDGVISNNSLANFTNVGTITFGGTISNVESGTITNQCSVIFVDEGTIVDNSILDLCGTDNNDAVSIPKPKKDDDSSSLTSIPELECGTGMVLKDRVCVNELENDFQINEKVPDWIKKNAGWWADGKIDESGFILGIEYLVNENIIVIHDVSILGINESEDVPDWFKTIASWWASDLIPEVDFVNAIQFLVEEGIIKIKNS